MMTPVEEEYEDPLDKLKRLKDFAESLNASESLTKPKALSVLSSTLDLIKDSIPPGFVEDSKTVNIILEAMYILKIAYPGLKHRMGSTPKTEPRISKSEDEENSTPNAILYGDILPRSIAFLFTACSLVSENPCTDPEHIPGVTRAIQSLPWIVPLKNQGIKALLRSNALKTLSVLFPSIKKSKLFPYWIYILPQSGFSPFKLSLTHCLKTDSIESLKAFRNFFDQSCEYFKVADAPKHTSNLSFVPWSHRLGASLALFHSEILDYLPEDNVKQQQAYIELLESMAWNLPYSKLGQGLLTDLIAKLRNILIKYKSLQNKTGVHRVFTALLDQNFSHPEVKPKFDSLFELFVQISFNLNGCKWDNNIRYAAIHNLSTLSLCDPESFSKKFTPNLLIHLFRCFEDPDKSVVIHGLKFVKRVGKALGTNGLAFWKAFLDHGVISTLEAQEFAPFKAALCACFGEIDPEVFESLPMDKKFLVITYLLSHAKLEEENSVSSSALRGIGSLISYNHDSEAFLIDASTVILGLMNKKICPSIVLNSASWAMANIAFILSKEDLEEFPNPLYLELLLKSMALSNNLSNSAGIRASSIRALGLLLRRPKPEIWSSINLKEIIRILLLNAFKGGVVKVCWNACYASGCLLNNPLLDSILGESLLYSVVSIIKTSSNLKVRISGASLMENVERKFISSEHFVELADNLLNGLIINDVVEDKEYSKHKAELQDAVILGLCRLIVIGTDKEIKELNRLSTNFADSLGTAISRTYFRVSPEKSSVMLLAKSRISQISNEDEILSLALNKALFFE